MATMKVEGAAQIEAFLRQLPEKVAKKVTTAALRTGGTVVAKAARAKLRANPSVDTAMLVTHIGVSTKKRPTKGSAEVSVGIRKGKALLVRKGKKKAQLVNPARYAHFIEFGTEHSKAEPFMRPALDTSGSAAVAKVIESAAKGINRETARLASR